MKYIEYKPIESLAEYIQLIWIAESESASDFYPREKILPDGIVEIVFHFGDTFIIYNAEGEKLKQPVGFAISQMQKFIEIESDGKIGFVSVRFFPWGAYHFFRKPVKDFLDNTIDLKHLWKNEHEPVLNQIKNVSYDEKVNIVQQFLCSRFIQNKKKTHNIDDAIKLIRATKGQNSIEEICSKTGLTYKQLERKFLATIGTTPKVFSRTTRFLHLCHHLKEYENKTLAELTYAMGYYDQAHFIKDFKMFTGLKPKEYYEHENICFADF